MIVEKSKNVFTKEDAKNIIRKKYNLLNKDEGFYGKEGLDMIITKNVVRNEEMEGLIITKEDFKNYFNKRNIISREEYEKYLEMKNNTWH